jgi:hypothetical protein
LQFSAAFWGDADIYSKIDKKSYERFKKILKHEFPDHRIKKNNFLVYVKYDADNIIDREAIFCLQQKVDELSVRTNNEYRNSGYIIYPFNSSSRSYLFISYSSHPDSFTRKAFLTGDAGSVAESIRFDSDYNADYTTYIPGFLFNINSPDK